jgi:hypothetical protein
MTVLREFYIYRTIVSIGDDRTMSKKVKIDNTKEKKGGWWSLTDLHQLEELYPAAFCEDLPLLFPGRSLGAIQQMANQLKLRHSTRKPYFLRDYSDVADGNYVSGLVDGEGSFKVSIVERRGRWNFNPRFEVGLRIDDKAILRWLQVYFGCGEYNEAWRERSPSGRFTISNLRDLLGNVIPHFETYPLRAKKRNDYVVWKSMLELQAQFFRLPWPNWVRDTMQQKYEELKQGRLLTEKV